MMRLEFGGKPLPKTTFLCASCSRVTDGRSIYCAACAANSQEHEHAIKGGLRFGRFVFKQGTRRLNLFRPLLPRADAHFAEIEWMVRNRYGRAMLAPNLIRWHEIRMGEA